MNDDQEAYMSDHERAPLLWSEGVWSTWLILN